MEMHGVSVIIPACDEEESIAGVLAELRGVLEDCGEYELVVVDDGSTDMTARAASEAGARVMAHASNRGYGAALKTGIRAARYDRIVITDADGTYPASFIPGLLASLEECDMVVGARTGGQVHIPLVRRPGKWILRTLTQYVTGSSVPDFNSGLRAFRRSLFLQYRHLLPDKFSFTTTITVACLCDGLRVKFLPIDYRPRVGRSKMRAVNFFIFIGLVLRLSTLFRPLRIFMPASLVCSAAGFVKMGLDIVVAMKNSGGMSFWQVLLSGREIVSTTSIVLIMAGLQIALVGLLAEAIANRSAAHPTDGRE